MSRMDLVWYITHGCVDVVLGRLPVELRSRLRDVVLWGDSHGVRRLGWVTRGRRDITLCARLPIRVSLRTYMYGGCKAVDFGAPERGQWPPWAVRRFLLYHVLLHELGHLQLVGTAPNAWDRDFASETLADEFANEWRGRLYSEPFRRGDPVHDAPSNDELEALEVWAGLDKIQRGRVAKLEDLRRIVDEA
jgi:hypothetical protein